VGATLTCDLAPVAASGFMVMVLETRGQQMLVAFAFGSSDRSGTKRRVHGLADAMPHEAGRAIAAKVQLALQLFDRHPPLVGGQGVKRQRPLAERHVRPFHQRVNGTAKVSKQRLQMISAWATRVPSCDRAAPRRPVTPRMASGHERSGCRATTSGS
jgi:hypothetical protein